MLTVFVPPEGEIQVRFVACGEGYRARLAINGYEVSDQETSWEVVEKMTLMLGASLLKQEDCTPKP